MQFKHGTWKETIKYWAVHPFAINVYIAIVVFFVLSFSVIQWLDTYTRHGQEIDLPNLKGMTVDEATDVLADKGLVCEVVDSVYSATVAPGHISEQVPEAGAKLKEGRKVYIYIRATSTRSIPLPDVRDLTSRQAQSTLEEAGFKVTNIEYVPSQFRDLVLSVKCDNRPIAMGTRLPAGAQLSLEVGRGVSEDMFPMPSFRGLTITQANERAKNKMLLVQKVIYDVTPTSEAQKASYIVYKQTPITNTRVNGSEVITVYVTTDQSKLDEPEEVFSDEEEPTEPDAEK